MFDGMFDGTFDGTFDGLFDGTRLTILQHLAAELRRLQEPPQDEGACAACYFALQSAMTKMACYFTLQSAMTKIAC